MKPLKPKDWVLLSLLLLTVLAVRMPFLLSPVLGEDAAYHAQAATTVLNGGLLYRDVPYTYPPLYAYTEALSIALLGNSPLAWKATAQIYDLGIIILIYLIVDKISNRKNALIAATLYGFSPLPFFATSSFASFDSTAAFWMLLSLFLLLTKKPVPSAIALGIGTAYKYFPLLILPAALIYLQTKRQKISYTIFSIATATLFQLPFILTEFQAWLKNVILFQLNRPAFGASVYNLISLRPQSTDVQNPLTILSPITLMLAFLIVIFNKTKTDQELLKNSAFIMVTAVFFSKVVLFYALWYIPLICILIPSLKTRPSTIVLISFLTLQAGLLLSWYAYTSSAFQVSLFLAYVYLATSALLLSWLAYSIQSKRIKLNKNSRNV